MTDGSEGPLSPRDIDFTKGGGLVPVIVQDHATGKVLMLAYMNAQALEKTLASGEMHYFSRSRNRLWRKGEESGHVQTVVSLRADCDQDTLLAIVHQHGPACHTGTETCFDGRPTLTGEAAAGLPELGRILSARRAAPPPGSYTAKLLADENLRLKKIGEEGAEVVIAAKGDSPERLASEIADLIYHALVAGAARGVTVDDVLRELAARRAPKGPPKGT
ncbi:MAG: bifunctional phosphoribosyl-AMP cyclohydrolase/phosphoribosyl-ATP diphosphatase HisIE [Thermoplasmatota archaeon]